LFCDGGPVRLVWSDETAASENRAGLNKMKATSLAVWNPTRHPELKIYVQGDVSGRGNTIDFQGLASVRSNSSVHGFVDAMLKLPQAAAKLQLSNSEGENVLSGGSGVVASYAGKRGHILEQSSRGASAEV
jgi:hypothetical protein